jgi:iron complex outermembrane receptor protein
VVVTARKREETAQSVPIPISALSETQLEARNITDLQDVERLTPNMNFTYSAVGNQNTQVFLRGIGQVNWSTTQDPKIGIYVDGVYLSRPQGGLVDLMDVERVEVLRGPQGTLFGRCV